MKEFIVDKGAGGNLDGMKRKRLQIRKGTWLLNMFNPYARRIDDQSVLLNFF